MQELAIREPVFQVTRIYVIDGKEFFDHFGGPIPEEIMTFAEQVLGNGQARISYGGDNGIKDYGNGPSVHINIAINCNQDDNTMATVVRQLGMWHRFFMAEQLPIAEEEYQKLFQQIKGPKTQQAGPPNFKPNFG
jgi:hypothetical protein